jgi:PIN domain nuclease of toxin-antitoxin system
LSGSVILDTHVLIWWVQKSTRLTAEAIAIIETAPEVYFSAASVFEIEIKRPKIPLLPIDLAAEFLKVGFLDLPITSDHAAEIGKQESLFGHDPFDRLLIAQAEATGLKLVTANGKLTKLQPSNTIAI